MKIVLNYNIVTQNITDDKGNYIAGPDYNLEDHELNELQLEHEAYNRGSRVGHDIGYKQGLHYGMSTTKALKQSEKEAIENKAYTRGYHSGMKMGESNQRRDTNNIRKKSYEAGVKDGIKRSKREEKLKEPKIRYNGEGYCAASWRLSDDKGKEQDRQFMSGEQWVKKYNKAPNIVVKAEDWPTREPTDQEKYYTMLLKEKEAKKKYYKEVGERLDKQDEELEKELLEEKKWNKIIATNETINVKINKALDDRFNLERRMNRTWFQNIEWVDVSIITVASFMVFATISYLCGVL